MKLKLRLKLSGESGCHEMKMKKERMTGEQQNNRTRERVRE